MRFSRILWKHCGYWHLINAPLCPSCASEVYVVHVSEYHKAEIRRKVGKGKGATPAKLVTKSATVQKATEQGFCCGPWQGELHTPVPFTETRKYSIYCKVVAEFLSRGHWKWRCFYFWTTESWTGHQCLRGGQREGQNFLQRDSIQGERMAQPWSVTSHLCCRVQLEERGKFQQLIRESQKVSKTQQVFPADVGKELKLDVFFMKTSYDSSPSLGFFPKYSAISLTLAKSNALSKATAWTV